MKWVKPFAIGYEYVYIPDKVINLTAERLLTLSVMIYICIDHATIYCHSRYSMKHFPLFCSSTKEPCAY